MIDGDTKRITRVSRRQHSLPKHFHPEFSDAIIFAGFTVAVHLRSRHIEGLPRFRFKIRDVFIHRTRNRAVLVIDD